MIGRIGGVWQAVGVYLHAAVEYAGSRVTRLGNISRRSVAATPFSLAHRRKDR